MARIEKTVFISYRRADRLWALIVFTWLTQRGFDVFIDYEGIGSGDFEAAIIENILSRAHFLILLAPNTLGRCNEPGDWIRREIEEAIRAKRNIVPVMLNGFSFGDAEIKKQTTGSLAVLPRYNGLSVEERSFEDDMLRLQRQFLNVEREAVTHPASARAMQIAAQQKSVAAKAPLPEYGEGAHYRRDSAAGAVPRPVAGGAVRQQPLSLVSKARARTDGNQQDGRSVGTLPTAESFWKRRDLPEPKPLRVRWKNAARIVPTRYSTLTLFDRVNNADEFDSLYAVEAMTNDRVREQVGRVELVSRADRIFGPGSGPIMMSFTHVNILGSDVSDGSFGVFYASREQHAAIADTKYHHERFLEATEQPAMYLPMRLYCVEINAVLYDLRPKEYDKIFKQDDYSLSQAVGRELYRIGAMGLIYRSLYADSGQTVALFKPRGASKCLHAAYLMYCWDGARFTDVYERRE